MYAIVEAGGKQYRVQEGDFLKVESLGVNEGEPFSSIRCSLSEETKRFQSAPLM